MVDSMASLVHEGNRKVKPAEDTSALDMQLCHINRTRKYWLSQTDESKLAHLGVVVREENDEWVPIDDLDEIRAQLKLSAKAVRDTFTEALQAGDGKLGPYDHPVLFLQHLVWHEGWHVGLIRLGLATAGEEPTEEWEEKHIWELWRGVEVWP